MCSSAEGHQGGFSALLTFGVGTEVSHVSHGWYRWGGESPEGLVKA